MMQRTIEWLNANAHRRYPFVDDAALTVTGPATKTVPNDLLLDFKQTIYVTGDPTQITQVSTLEVAAGSLTVTFQSYNGPWSVVVPAAASYPYRTRNYSNAFQYNIVFGPGLGTVLGWTAGVYTFTTPPQLQPGLIVIQNKHRLDTVQAVGVDQDILYGKVYVEPGYNCDVIVVPDKIQLLAGLGLGAGVYCGEPEDDEITCNYAFLRWNGIHAGVHGDIQLIGGPGVEIEPKPDDHTVVIRGTKTLENLKCG